MQHFLSKSSVLTYLYCHYLSGATLICGSVLHLDHGVSRRRGLDGSSAALRLIVGSVVRPGLHLDAQLVLVELGRQRPVERRQSVGPGWGQEIVRLVQVIHCVADELMRFTHNLRMQTLQLQKQTKKTLTKHTATFVG